MCLCFARIKNTLFSLSMLTSNILHCEQAGSNFRATYVVDWDKDNYFSILNVRRRKFEKERQEQQERIEAERAKKEEARQAELALAEEERQKVEEVAAALRSVLLHSTVEWLCQVCYLADVMNLDGMCAQHHDLTSLHANGPFVSCKTCVEC